MIFLRKLIPQPILSAYHLSLAYLGAVWYRFPSQKLFVIGVTGTKGKSTVVELVRAILVEAGYTVAAASTIRFSIGAESEPNLFKMTMPGRLFLQRFLRRAVDAGCTHAVVEMTSEGAKQFRHKGIALDALVFTNLAPEHIESHGGLQKYAEAKLLLARHLEQSGKRPRIIAANQDDAYGKKFLEAGVEVRAPFSLRDAEPYQADDRGVRFVWHRGMLISAPLPGLFNLQNILAAMTLCSAMRIPEEIMKRAIEHMSPVAGRAERVEKGQPFTVVVDYAHTPDSLRALFETYSKHRIVAVFGATGGGRDRWKRPVMGKVADEFCAAAFLTDDDSYDENPQNIAEEIARGFSKIQPHILVDRRAAISKAFEIALSMSKGSSQNIAVLLMGKGTDPYLMGPRGAKQPWSDKKVAEEELKRLGYAPGK